MEKEQNIIRAFKYLVAYQFMLEEKIKECKNDLDWNEFEASFKELVVKYVKDKEKELEDLKSLIKNWI